MTQNKRSFFLRASVVGALFAALSSWACGGGGDVDVVPTAPVEQGRIERIVVATGTIEPEKEIGVRARIAGIIEKIYVDDGDEVEEGAPLLALDSTLLRAQVREAAAGLREAEIVARYAGIDLDRSNRLQTTGVTSVDALDDARAQVERAQATVARARANLDSLDTRLGYATVSAPIVGRILEVHVEEGDAVSPVTSVTGGTVLISLAGDKTLHLEGLVDENEVARVQIGQLARIRTEAFADRIFEAVVREIAPLGRRIQNVTYFEVELEITDPDALLLRPRMSGDAEIVAEVVDDALIIPETALHYGGDRIYVNTVSGGAQENVVPKDVTIGIVDDTRVQILNGLDASDVVQLQ